MPFITTSDGTEIYYTDQGDGRPIVLSHGWPLSSDAWQVELKLFRGCRLSGPHDRRVHGRSAKTHSGNDMETYARDLAELMDSLNLCDTVPVALDGRR
jgi:non-heme chloroperoxidase